MRPPNKISARLRLLFVLLAAFSAIVHAQAHSASVTVYLFWAEGCPHCSRAVSYLETWAGQRDSPPIRYLELTREPDNRRVFSAITEHFAIKHPGVPLTVIGERFFQGFSDDGATGEAIKTAAADCVRSACNDIVHPLLTGSETRSDLQACARSTALPKVLKLPIFGEVSIAHVSLPVLTVMLGAIDGFNPCAMWTLIFLIGLLIGLKDRFRMWVLGSVFIVASAAIYYLFMAAWLNLLLFIGMLLWIRLLIGLMALAGGGYYLRDYFTNPEAVCKVTSSASRQRVFAGLRTLAGERRFLLAITGIVLLAFLVNLVELICSAGIPAVYTQILALSELPTWQYHAYLGLYILVFMSDDLLIFFVAMKTLQVTGLTGTYARHAQAVGGAVLLAVGLLLIFKPEWLTFTI